VAQRGRPDLILLDIVMPGMSGFEVMTKLKKNGVTKNIPVILVTGLDSIQDEKNGVLLGAVDFIKKPFFDHVVKLKVKTHLTM